MVEHPGPCMGFTQGTDATIVPQNVEEFTIIMQLFAY